MKKSDIIEKVADYIESLPEGTRTTTLRAINELYPDINKIDAFDLHFDIADEINRRKNVTLDMSEHDGMLEGLPQYLAFTVRKRIPDDELNDKEEDYE